MPIKSVNGSTVFIKDIGHVSDKYLPQTNLVHIDGKKGVLEPIYKLGGASTLDIVKRVRAALPIVLQRIPNFEELKITPLFDQSVFVRAAVWGVVKEAVIAAALTGLMILLFLGSWRSTLIICISIPLSILVSIIVLWALGETLNVMTLGGMALAVGILVDDATVEIENIHRNLHQRKRLVQAILDGASRSPCRRSSRRCASASSSSRSGSSPARPSHCLFRWRWRCALAHHLIIGLSARCRGR